MNEKYVTNIFWSSGYTNGGLVYLLYSDNTYDAVRTKHHPDFGRERYGRHYTTFRKYCNLKILRNEKFTKTKAVEYIKRKDEEFQEPLE